MSRTTHVIIFCMDALQCFECMTILDRPGCPEKNHNFVYDIPLLKAVPVKVSLKPPPKEVLRPKNPIELTLTEDELLNPSVSEDEAMAVNTPPATPTTWTELINREPENEVK